MGRDPMAAVRTITAAAPIMAVGTIGLTRRGDQKEDQVIRGSGIGENGYRGYKR